MPHVLIVDDEAALRRRLEQIFRDRGHEPESVASGEAALEAVRKRRPDLVMLDVHMEGIDGIETLRRLCVSAPGVPVVIMTGAGGVETAVSAFKLGAVDFITKPFELPKLLATIDAILAGGDAPRPTERQLIGESVKFREVMAQAIRFARPDINVVLEGETGTGKELFARTIHEASKRKAGPFVPVDCSILSESLIESELFGHEKGAFTGAVGSRAGHFERANGGTLFLDEIGNIPMPLQAKLLRVLQERTVERVGGRETIHLDIRVVSATNANLLDAIRAGTFRSDLYYRLAEVKITPPPLRERAGDVERIAQHFVRLYAAEYNLPVKGITPAALDRLTAYSWPGNVRELRSVIKAAVVYADELVEPSHILLGGEAGPTSVPSSMPSVSSASSRGDRIVVEIDIGADDELDLKALAGAAGERAERAVLEAILAKKRYSHAELSRMMNVDPKTLRAKLRKYGLEPGG